MNSSIGCLHLLTTTKFQAIFAFFNGDLKSACGCLRNKCRESRINPFSVFIWADGIHQLDGSAGWALNFYKTFSHLMVSSVASKHPQQFLKPEQPFRDFSIPYCCSQRPLLYSATISSNDMLLRLHAAHAVAKLLCTLGHFFFAIYPFKHHWAIISPTVSP